ncbi:MAG TPA: glycosyltransferase [Burkholderiales bacterium]|nr:glycosyltransferase [Burkholderiales bacterium]
MSLRVSVVVPTCGRADLLARCLQALENQSLPREQYEIVVVDDSRLRSGPAAARNRGWRRANANIIAFTDDDTVPDHEWLERGLEAIQDQAMQDHVDAISGRIVMPIPATPTDYERDAQGLERSEFVTANCFVRKHILERLNGFDEGFRMAWREDSDLHFRLLQCGARLVHAPRAVVVHPVRPASWGVSVKQQRKVMYDALLFKKHRRLYRERIRASARWDYYLIVTSLVAAAGGFTPALLLWALLSIRFCLQRLKGASKRPGHVLEMLTTSILIPPLAVFWRFAGALRYRVAFL